MQSEIHRCYVLIHKFERAVELSELRHTCMLFTKNGQHTVFSVCITGVYGSTNMGFLELIPVYQLIVSAIFSNQLLVTKICNGGRIFKF